MIRGFQDTDLERIGEIWLNTNIKAHDFIPDHYWRENFKAVKAMFLQAEIYVYKDEITNQIQGFIGLLHHNYIAGIFVCSKVQSNGIGKRLLDFIKESRTELNLNVYQKNIRAIKFYQRENFVVCRESVDESTEEKEFGMAWKR